MSDPMYHMLAFILGFLLDLLIGDPHWLFHPVRLMGRLTGFLERTLYRRESPGKEKKEMGQGIALVCLVLSAAGAASGALLVGAYHLHPCMGFFVETIMTYQILAIKCLKVESMKVYDALKKGNLTEAKKAVSMIVGRDTEALDETGVARAAVETVAENTSDGVIAPMLYLAVGGPVLGFLYKAVNTMDSMVGYQNDRYLFFGRAAAKLDDAVNYLPARISALLIILAAFLPGRAFCGRKAYRIFRRDRFLHESPNSAQTEAACAGALQIQLGGDASYFGKIHHKPAIGDAIRPVETEDIKRANRLMYRAAFLGEMLCVLALCIFQRILQILS